MHFQVWSMEHAILTNCLVLPTILRGPRIAAAADQHRMRVSRLWGNPTDAGLLYSRLQLPSLQVDYSTVISTNEHS
ncbi:hypothetical protein BDV06DRAFT_183945 [Aspergillus oleicola]